MDLCFIGGVIASAGSFFALIYGLYRSMSEASYFDDDWPTYEQYDREHDNPKSYWEFSHNPDKLNSEEGAVVASTFGEGNTVMIIVLSTISVAAIICGAVYVKKRKKDVSEEN